MAESIAARRWPRINGRSPFGRSPVGGVPRLRLKKPASNRTRKVGLYSELIDAPEGCWLDQERVMFLRQPN